MVTENEELDDDDVTWSSDTDISEEAPEPFEPLSHIETPIYRKGLWLISERMFRKVHTEWEWGDFVKWSAFQSPIVLRIGSIECNIERRYYLWSQYIRWFRGCKP